MAETVTIRAAQESDIDALAILSLESEVYLNALEVKPKQTVIPAISTDAFRRDGFGANPWFSGLLAERGNEPLGYLLYHFGYWADDAAGALFVADLFVREQVRRQGVGRKLMTEAAKILRARGGKMMLWAVWHRNPAAQAFYQGLGATHVSDEHLMCWKATAWPDAKA